MNRRCRRRGHRWSESWCGSDGRYYRMCLRSQCSFWQVSYEDDFEEF